MEISKSSYRVYSECLLAYSGAPIQRVVDIIEVWCPIARFERKLLLHAQLL